MTSLLKIAFTLGCIILFLGLLTLLERSAVCARRWWLQGQAKRGDRGARAILQLRESPERLASSMEVATALVGTFIGVFAGFNIEPLLTHGHEEMFFEDSLIVFTLEVVLAVVTILFGILLPRRLATLRPERTACALARPFAWIVTSLGRIGESLDLAAERLSRMLGVKSTPARVVSIEEIKSVLEEGQRAGVLEEAEHQIFRRVFRFCERRARAIMTPREKVVWLDVADSPEEIRRKVVNSQHSRFPVCDGSLDNLLGIVQAKDLLGQVPTETSFHLKGLLTFPAFIYEGTRGVHVREILEKSSTHTAIVLDEYGSVVGVLTLSDILESLLGDLPEHSSEESPRSAKQPDGSWLFDGRFPLDEFRDLLDLPEFPDGDYDTLAGFLVTEFRHIPKAGESLERFGYRFEIKRMDSQRVDQIRVSPV